jgi:hypothetical protein
VSWVLWNVPPVVVKVLGIAAYDVPDEVSHLQVADSFEVTLMVACVVPAANVPVGAPLLTTGGVTSPGVVTFTRFEYGPRFGAASAARTRYLKVVF